jgi:MATE family multidrug resistance protein
MCASRQVRPPLFGRLADIATGETGNDLIVAREQDVHLQLGQAHERVFEFRGIGPKEVEAADGIIGIDHIPRNKDLLGTMVQGDTPCGVSGDMDDLPRHAADIQAPAPLELSLHLKGELTGLEAILHLAHLLEHIHTVDGPFIPLFQGFGLFFMHPQLGPGDLLTDLSQAPDVVQMGMGHDDPLDGRRLDPQLADGLDLVSPLARETCIDEGEILGGGIADYVDVGVRDKLILSWDEKDTVCYLRHIVLLAQMKFSLLDRQVLQHTLWKAVVQGLLDKGQSSLYREKTLPFLLKRRYNTPHLCEMNAVSLKAHNTDLTKGGLWGHIWRLSWPMLLIMILNFLVGFVDIYVAGLINTKVQAAVGFISQLYFLLIIVANAISIGTVALVSRNVGSGDFARAIANAKQSLIFGFFIAMALTITSLFFSRQIIAAAGFPLEISAIGESFLRIFAFALGPSYLLIISNAVFRASGEVKKPLLTMSVFSAVTIIGDFCLVFGIPPFPKLGYLGIALSTAIAATLGMAINFGLFALHPWRALYRRPWTISVSSIKTIASLGWPAALLQIAWNAGSIVLYNILGRLGEASITALASLTNGLRIEAIIFLPPFAFNMAASILVGQNLGANNPERAKAVGWKITGAGVMLISVVSICIFIWASSFASLLAKEPAVLAETTRYLRIMMFSEPFMALSLILGGGLQGAGDTRGNMWVIVISMWLIRLPLAFLLALVLGYGAVGVWLAMITSMTVQGTLMARRFHQGRWKHLQVE